MATAHHETNKLNDTVTLAYDQDTTTIINSKALDRVAEDVLQDILDFLKELQDQPADKIRLTNNLRQILAEDKALLEDWRGDSTA